MTDDGGYSAEIIETCACIPSLSSFVHTSPKLCWSRHFFTGMTLVQPVELPLQQLLKR